jgi:hypothetical protein
MVAEMSALLLAAAGTAAAITVQAWQQGRGAETALFALLTLATIAVLVVLP